MRDGAFRAATPGAAAPVCAAAKAQRRRACRGQGRRCESVDRGLCRSAYLLAGRLRGWPRSGASEPFSGGRPGPGPPLRFRLIAKIAVVGRGVALATSQGAFQSPAHGSAKRRLFFIRSRMSDIPCASKPPKPISCSFRPGAPARVHPSNHRPPGRDLPRRSPGEEAKRAARLEGRFGRRRTLRPACRHPKR